MVGAPPTLQIWKARSGLQAELRKNFGAEIRVLQGALFGKCNDRPSALQGARHSKATRFDAQ